MKKLHSISIGGPEHQMFPEVWACYEQSFPPEERRDASAQERLLRQPGYRLEAWMERESFVGFMAWWDFCDCRYVEHFAVHPDHRSGGTGAAIMQAWLQADPRPVCLEIEDPVDDLTCRRFGFYQRLGFVLYPERHCQPPYDGQGRQVPMALLSRPHALAPDQRDQVLRALRTRVWADLPLGACAGRPDAVCSPGREQ